MSAYEITEVIYSGASTIVFRAVNTNGKSYIIKVHTKSVPSQRKIQKYFKEFSLGASINSKFVVKYVEMKKFGYGFAIVMEDIGGGSIKKLLPTQGFSAAEFYPLAINIVTGLMAIHDAGVVHKDINPYNIIYNPTTKEVNIIDFDISSRLSREETPAVSPHQMRGTLLYMSPEQTGRMNRHVDYRSDFYSLGVTFFEVLSGKPPFHHSGDPLELIYKHLAVMPRSLYEIREDIPKPLSDLVAKLMAKNAEERYQDCHGILEDLVALYNLFKVGKLTNDFVIGQQDQPHFHISQKLYGRTEQTKILTKVFDDISGGLVPTCLMLVHGYSGIGKTTLVNEVHKPLVRDRGYYVYGKFNQFSGQVPYSAFIQALKQLMQQFLTESKERLEKWQEKLRRALSTNGQVVIDVIPEVELVIGPQPPVPKLNNTDSQNRFRQMFVNFISALSGPNHPLVIFVDDLQWADTNTLNLLTTLLTTNPSHLLILGAYRDNEVDDDHPLIRTIREITHKGGNVKDLLLLPLDLVDVEELVRDSFSLGHIEFSYTQSLANIVHIKTNGNPFFISQFLTTLYQDGHIALNNSPSVHWVCNTDKIKAANYTNNVVDLVLTKLKKMPEEVQKVLGIAAQIGNQFERQLLGQICQLPDIRMMHILCLAMQENFIISMDREFEVINDEQVKGDLILKRRELLPDPSKALDEQTTSDYEGQSAFRFGHDRIQQASAILVLESEVPKIHFQVAERLLERCQGNSKMIDENLLFIVNHMNKGFKLSELHYPIPGDDGKYLPLGALAIARLNLRASEKSKNTNAYSQSIIYANVGIEILEKWEEQSWKDHYQLLFSLYSAKAEVSYLLGQYKEAEALYPFLLEKANCRVDKCSAYLIMFSQFEVQNRYLEVFRVIRLGLELFGVVLPTIEDIEECKIVFHANVAAIRKQVPTDQVASVLDHPSCQDEDSLTIIRLLTPLFAASYILGIQYFTAVAVSEIVRYSIERGLCEDSILGFATYGFTIGPLLGDYFSGYEYVRLAAALADSRFQRSASKPRVYMMFALAAAWCEPIAEKFDYLVTAFELSSSIGNASWASYSASYIITYETFRGTQLSELMRTYNKYIKYLCANNRYYYYQTIAIFQPIHDMIGDNYNYETDSRVDMSMFETESWCRVGRVFGTIMSAYIMQNKTGWLKLADNSIAVIPKLLPGLFFVPEVQTLSSLLYLDWMVCSHLVNEVYAHDKKRTQGILCSSIDEEGDVPKDRDTMIKRLYERVANVRNSIVELKKLVNACPGNYLHKELIVRAECARVSIILGTTAPFIEENEAPQKQDFEEAMELYEKSIQSARDHGFNYYEAMALELYGRFWLTAPNSPKPQMASGYLAESIFTYEKYGALAKAQLIRTTYGSLLTINGRMYGLSPTVKHKKPVSDNTFSLDLETVVQASQTISNEADMNKLIWKMIKTIAENSGAQRGALFTTDETSGLLLVSAEYDEEMALRKRQGSQSKSKQDGITRRLTREVLSKGHSGVLHQSKRDVFHINEQGNIEVHQTDNNLPVSYGRDSISESDCEAIVTVFVNPCPIDEWQNGPQSVVNYVCRTVQPLLLACAFKDSRFGADAYISNIQVKSVLCMPIVLKNALKGVMYLENNLYEGLFTRHRMELLNVLTSQMAITIENARFFKVQMQEQIEKLRFEQLTRDEERQRLRADAAEKYKQQLENFMDMICHEIRNPLNGIFGNTDLAFYYMHNVESVISCLKSGVDISQKEVELADLLLQLKNSIGSIQTCAEHQKCITDDVLQLSKLRAHKLVLTNSWFDPKDLVDTVVKMFKVEADNKGLCITLNASECRKPLWADPVRVTQIVTNLISNAIKFTHIGGITINVSIEADINSERKFCCQYDDNTDLEVNMSPDGNTHEANESSTCTPNSDLTLTEPTVPLVNPNLDTICQLNGHSVESCYLKISVKDTGIGMTKEEQSRIFRRFTQANSRTSSEYGGSGLGLAICKILSKLMDGYLYVDSIKDKGSTFCLSVHCKQCIGPAVQSIRLSSEIAPKIVTSKIASTQDILVVEDNVTNQLVLTRLLQIRGYKVHVANNGKEAVDKYTEQPLAFTAVLMDMQMPVMDGLEATMLIRKYEKENEIRNTAIIALSGNARDEYKLQAFAAGMNEYITKPYRKEVIYALLEKMNM